MFAQAAKEAISIRSPRRGLAGVLALLMCCLCIGRAYAETVTSPVVQRLLENHLRKQQLPGGVVLVSTPQQRFVVVSGIAERRTNRPVAQNSRFYVASVGKMAVAAAVLSLIEDEKVSEDSPVLPLVDDIANIKKLANVRKAKVGQLLNHSSGIPDYLTDEFADFMHSNSIRLTPAIALPYAYDQVAAHKAGKGYEYSNSNFVLLGHIIAKLDGVSLEIALKKRVFSLAGMQDTSVGADPNSDNLAHGYADLDGTGTEQDCSIYAWNSPLGDGPLVTTAGDYEKFLFALFRDGKLLKPDMLARMTSPSRQEEEYGMGVELGNDKWGDWIGHDGSDDGFEAEVRYYPQHQAVLVFMSNGNASGDASLLTKVAASLAKMSKLSR